MSTAPKLPTVVPFACAACAASALLFMVQPLVGALLLPSTGGAAQAWTVCLMFFQLALFLGYLWAHVLASRFTVPAQVGLHGGLVLIALLTSGAIDAPPRNFDLHTHLPLQLSWWLTHQVGLSVVGLAATGPLLQRWWATAAGRHPHRLYAWSNLGSLTALLAYPLIIEVTLTRRSTSELWLWALAGQCVLILVAGSSSVRHRSNHDSEHDAGEQVQAPRSTKASQKWIWLACSFLPCVLLMAVSSRLTLDVAAGPLIWMAPLAVYSATFVVAFQSGARTRAVAAHWLWMLACACTALDWLIGVEFGLALQALIALTLLGSGSLICHRELVRLRPAPNQLTEFYLWIAAGGALGGLVAGIIAPAVTSAPIELPLAAIAMPCLWLWTQRYPRTSTAKSRSATAKGLWLSVGLTLPLMGAVVLSEYARHWRGVEVLARARGFFGTLRVTRDDRALHLVHGRILHGMQWRAADMRRQPTMYFGPQSGIGRLLARPGPPRKVGIVGLGIATLASYGRADDHFDFFEINADVVELAQRYFSFASTSAAEVQTYIGDGRIAIGRRPQAYYDIVVLDAFSSDAVPTHLLTREAVVEYLERIARDGVLAFNLSNRHLDLARVVAGSARALDLHGLVVDSSGARSEGLAPARWVLLSRSQTRLTEIGAGVDLATIPAPVLWTDDWSSIVPILIDAGQSQREPRANSEALPTRAGISLALPN